MLANDEPSFDASSCCVAVAAAAADDVDVPDDEFVDVCLYGLVAPALASSAMARFLFGLTDDDDDDDERDFLRSSLVLRRDADADVEPPDLLP